MNRKFKRGDIVLLKEETLEVTEPTLAYIYDIFYSFKDTPKIGVALITENSEIIPFIPLSMYKYLIFVAESPYIYTGTRIQDWDDRESNIERDVIKSLLENLGAESEYMNIICRKHSKYWLKR